MKSFFDKDERYTEDAGKLDAEASRLLKPMFRKYRKKGYTLRDINSVIQGACSETMMDLMLESPEDMESSPQELPTKGSHWPLR